MATLTKISSLLDLQISYSNNAAAMSAGTAQTVSWITPSTNLNNGFRIYEVDSAGSKNFDTSNAYMHFCVACQHPESVTECPVSTQLDLSHKPVLIG